jgi:arginase family enzyme
MINKLVVFIENINSTSAKYRKVVFSVSIVGVLLLNNTSVIASILTSKANSALDDLKINSCYENYEIAENEIQKINDTSEKIVLTAKLNRYSFVITPDLQRVLDNLTELKIKKDIATYEETLTLIDDIENLVDREYLLSEVTSWGSEFVYTDNTIKAIESLLVASNDYSLDNVTKAEKSIVNKLCYENLWTMYYLQGKLNNLTYENTKDKKQILILGDSISLGMATRYKNNGGSKTTIENVYWQYISKEKYNVNFLAVGGLGLIEKPQINDTQMDNALNLLKYQEKYSGVNKEYDKIFITFGTNDSQNSKASYMDALDEYVSYILENYNANEYILMNFYFYEKQMEKIAEKYDITYIDIDMDCVDISDDDIYAIHPSVKGQEEIFEQLSTRMSLFK